MPLLLGEGEGGGVITRCGAVHLYDLTVCACSVCGGLKKPRGKQEKTRRRGKQKDTQTTAVARYAHDLFFCLSLLSFEALGGCLHGLLLLSVAGLG